MRMTEEEYKVFLKFTTLRTAVKDNKESIDESVFIVLNEINSKLDTFD